MTFFICKNGTGMLYSRSLVLIASAHSSFYGSSGTQNKKWNQIFDPAKLCHGSLENLSYYRY